MEMRGHVDSSTSGGGSVNQLGGTFLNGRPLAPSQRRRIIELATQGARPSDISKITRVSNGCVSKILSRFYKTGLLDPKAIGGSRPRLLTSEVICRIVQCKKENPTIFGWEIRKKLATQYHCKPSQVPSVSSINRFLRKLHLSQGPMCMEINTLNGAYPDEACEQEDHSDNLKRKNSLNQNRTTYTQDQCNALEQAFSESQYADMYTREKISAKIQLPEAKIKVWFSNRRAKWRRETKQQEKSKSPTVVVSHPKGGLVQMDSTGCNTTAQQIALREMKSSHTLEPWKSRDSLAWGNITNYHLLRHRCLGAYEHPPVMGPSPSLQLHRNQVFPSSPTMNKRNPSCHHAERYSWPVGHQYTGAKTLLPFTYTAQCWNPPGGDFSLVPCSTNEGLRLAQHQDMVYELI